jgi:hypothetical protein
MSELKTKPTEVTVESFLDMTGDESVRSDCYKIIDLMEKVTGEKAKMWGPSIIGFGQYHYKYASGHEGDICMTGFSPRKGKITIYGLAGAPGQTALLEKLGKHKAGKGCLYIKKLDDVDLDVLETLIVNTIAHLKKLFGN